LYFRFYLSPSSPSSSELARSFVEKIGRLIDSRLPPRGSKSGRRRNKLVASLAMRLGSQLSQPFDQMISNFDGNWLHQNDWS
jgi:hypothetical protein